jgi:hypothetical protein
MAVPLVTPRVARIHYDSNKQTWHLHGSELKKAPSSTYTAPELIETFDSLTALLQALLSFWLLAAPNRPNEVNAIIGSMAGFAVWLQDQFDEGTFPVTSDPTVG